MEHHMRGEKQARQNGDPWWQQSYQLSATTQLGRSPGTRAGNSSAAPFMSRQYGTPEAHGPTDQFWVVFCDPRDLEAVQQGKVMLKGADAVVSACRENPDGTRVLAQVPGSTWISGRAFLLSQNIPVPYSAPPGASDAMIWYGKDGARGGLHGPEGDAGATIMPVPLTGEGQRPGDWDMSRDLLRSRPGPPERMDSGRIGVRHPPAPISHQDSGQGFMGMGGRARPMFNMPWSSADIGTSLPPGQLYDSAGHSALQGRAGMTQQVPPGQPLQHGPVEPHPQLWQEQDDAAAPQFTQPYGANMQRQNINAKQPEIIRLPFQGNSQLGPPIDSWMVQPPAGMAPLPTHTAASTLAAPAQPHKHSMHVRQPPNPPPPQQGAYAGQVGSEPLPQLLPHMQPPPPVGPPPDHQPPTFHPSVTNNPPPWVTSPWTAQTSLELDSELRTRISKLQGIWGIPYGAWTEEWQDVNRTAITLLLASSVKAWEDEGWKMQDFEWEAQYADANMDCAGHGNEHVIHPESISTEQAEKVFGDRDPSFSAVQIAALQEAGDLVELPHEGCWTLTEGRHLPQDPRRAGARPFEVDGVLVLAVPSFAITAELDAWNPACNLLAIGSENPENVPWETLSPASSWSSHQKDEPNDEVIETLARPSVLRAPESGSWTFYDDSGSEHLNDTMAELRRHAQAGVIPFGSSVYRKEDGLWLQLRSTPYSSDVTCIGTFASVCLDHYSIRPWFVNTQDLALRTSSRISHSPKRLQDWVGRCPKLLGQAADSGPEYESGWFDLYSVTNVASSKQATVQALLSGINIWHVDSMAGVQARDYLGGQPPPQFAATLRAEMHKKVVQGEAGKVMAGKLLQDVIGTMFKAFSANQLVSKLPDGAPTAALRKDLQPIAGPASRTQWTPADSSVVGAKRKLELEGNAPCPDPERPSRTQFDAKQQGFFGPIGDSKIDKDRVKITKDRGRSSVQQNVKRSRDTTITAKPDPPAKKWDKTERAIKLVLERLHKFDRMDLESCFAEPVIEVFPAIKDDYLAVVRKPIALSDMMTKLHNHYYKSPRGWEIFGEDVHRMVRNCQMYNKGRPRYQELSQHILQKFSDLCHEHRRLMQ